ncbi:uncharacterized protein YbjT (DUF2867 family) [Enterococcus sp. PF1-24]|uniref:SDR family oxidoreductase n=1 Tax=unclassified Enterococcus TaxID=2608891 RepID=UPI0024741765|nr:MULTISPECIES: NmrA family NAD(P)-binding protein [unclassified Enterococcus]MDH6363911.1 uncharacterized protein YbjT (DUF2867 family) [Enterococcus sp. PFB1-1]MDH6400903.1 uncharacterized protein YbjT (DUF2867 family) [Enterococcus sp. PF1-24]
MILVTAAAGGVASRVIPVLIAKGLKVKAFDISPKVENLKEIGVAETFVGDARSKEDIAKALEGCEQVLYIPPMFVYDEAEIANAFVDAAAEAGVKQFVMMSVTHPLMSTLLQHTQKLKAEEHLVYKGLSHGLNYTILQPMHYMHNFDVANVSATNSYQCFYTLSTKLSYVDILDVAEVAAKVLSETGHENATYELVGTDFLSPNDMVAKFNQAANRQSVAEKITVADIADYFGNGKYDSYFMKTFECLAETYGKYGIAGNANVLTWLLGRKPTTFDEYLQRELVK